MTNTIKTPTDAELLPCPFCGHQPEPSGHYAVICMGCGVNGPTGGDFEEARTAWNRRAAPAGGPVGEVGTMPGTSGFTMACFHADKVPLGTKLYTAPPTQPAEPAEPQRMPDLTQLTKRGATAWAGVDPQGMREGRVSLTEPSTPEFVALGQFIMACKDQKMRGPALTEAMRFLAGGGIKHNEGGQHD